MVDIIQGDYGSDLDFTITDSDSTALNLSSNTGIIFRMRNKTGKTTNIAGACVVDSEANGTCHYTLADGDTDTVGEYEWEVEVSYENKVLTSKGSENIVIIEQFD